MHILLYSNHHTLTVHIQQSLNNSGGAYTLICSNTLADAIKVCRLNHPSLIILDISTTAYDLFSQKFIEHYQKQLRPAIVMLSQDNAMPTDIASLGMQGFSTYSDDDFPCMTDILARCTQPTLAQRQDHACIIVHNHRGDERVFIDDIFYCQAEQKYTKIHHRHGTTLTDDTLKLLESLHPTKFIRIHRHTLVGTAYIRAITNDDGHRLHLYGINESFDISRRCLPSLRNQLKTALTK